MSFWGTIVKLLELWITRLKLEAPIPTLREAIKQKQWFSGIVMSTAFFEVWGLELLKEKFQGKIADDRLERLRLEEIILLLYSSKIIDQRTYTKMMEVKEVRNRIVHNPYKLLELEKPETLISKAVDCLMALGLPDKKMSLDNFGLLREKEPMTTKIEEVGNNNSV